MKRSLFPVLACAFALALVGTPTLAIAEEEAAVSAACALIPDDDAREFAQAEYDRSELGSTACTISVMQDGTYNRYLFVSLSVFEAPPAMDGVEFKMPDYAKDMVEQSSGLATADGGKPLKCTVAGPKYFACFDVASPLGSFQEGQRMALVLFGKGDRFVRVMAFHDQRPNFDAARAIAEKIYKRLP